MPEEIQKEIQNIPLADVTEAVERYLMPENFSHVYVVPKGAKIS